MLSREHATCEWIVRIESHSQSSQARKQLRFYRRGLCAEVLEHGSIIMNRKVAAGPREVPHLVVEGPRRRREAIGSRLRAAAAGR